MIDVFKQRLSAPGAVIAVSSPTSHAEMVQAHKARMARFAAAARKAPRIALPAPVDIPEPEPVKATVIPHWAFEPTLFNHHVIAFRRHSLQEEMRLIKGLGSIEIREQPKTMKEIVIEVLKGFPDVTLGEVIGPRRSKRFVKPRQLAMYEIRTQRPDLSFPIIGRFFSGRDHTTVLHACRQVEAMKARGE